MFSHTFDELLTHWNVVSGEKREDWAFVTYYALEEGFCENPLCERQYRPPTPILGLHPAVWDDDDGGGFDSEPVVLVCSRACAVTLVTKWQQYVEPDETWH